ncbi:hypothetical protein IMSAGC014_01581 [Bacteroidaceae bacterium]|uniref:DUF6965 family protein n=1 Tax=Prevotella sp. MGM2 TaxID=2033406 RepID=UPI000CEA1D22|nr:hypothetical protein [Prevotella sp. MGM2]GAY29472.1 hypothetical protein PvtlMGM2_0325 [Prevotella sp. MGM2]GFI35071.1 hypothetical protein IMSAGC014_01581 [Bacteroidaceae bacterium]
MNSNMYKKNYTKEDMLEIASWFKRHAAEIPMRVELDRATVYENMPETLAAYFEVYDIHGDNPTFSGQMHQLFLLRRRLREMGIGVED